MSLQNVFVAFDQEYLVSFYLSVFHIYSEVLIYKKKNELMMLQMLYVMYSFYFMCRWLLDKSEQYNTLGGNALSF